jgi:hypothetical protein
MRRPWQGERVGAADVVRGQCGKRTAGGAAGRVRRRGDVQTKGGDRLCRRQRGGRERVRDDSRAPQPTCMWFNGRETRILQYRTAYVTRYADLAANGLTGDVDRSTAREITQVSIVKDILPCLVAGCKVFEIEYFHISSIKYRLIKN